MKNGSIILLNGSSSSGKTTLSMMLQQLLRDPYQHVALDQFRDGLPGRYRGFNSPDGTTGSDGLNITPVELNGESVTAVRFGVHGEKLLKGMRRAIAAIANTGLNVIIDDLLFEESFVEDYAHVLAEFDVTIVGVRCPLDVVRQRESERPGRFPGTATWHFDKVHEHMIYDVEVDTANKSPRECALTVMNALENKPAMSAIRQLAARYPPTND
jgi:chloramphenicol 3-O phosphotransferase